MKIDPTTLRLPFSGSDTVKENYSKHGQDIFVLSCLDGKRKGKFLDLGCYHPVHHNKTYLLENKFGWEGVSMDIDEKMINQWPVRTSLGLVKDCTLITPTQFDFVFSTIGIGAGSKEAWDKTPDATRNEAVNNSINLALSYKPREHIDYLSIELSPATATLQCLYSVPFDKATFSIITYTHDAHNFGTISSNMSRSVLETLGYRRICSNIVSSGHSIEDWYYNPEFVSYERIKVLEGEGKDWHEALFTEDRRSEHPEQIRIDNRMRKQMSGDTSVSGYSRQSFIKRTDWEKLE